MNRPKKKVKILKKSFKDLSPVIGGWEYW